MMNTKSRFLLIVVTILLLLITPIFALQQQPNDNGRKPASLAQEMDAAEVEAFMDEIIEAQLEASHIPGAVVSVVQNGKLILAKGYGYGNIEKKIPASADKTLFRTGSVSKLFLWTAIMQLVEQGKLDLNADVNMYLSEFKIPATYAKPITIADLMNHTTGFEERAIKESVEHAEDIRPLGEYLADRMPARVRPPGEITAYSNYGASLAGYIVGQISGMSFEEYVEKYIFQPLNMKNSTFRQPVPSDLISYLAVGYTFEDDTYKAQDFEWKQSWPAGSQSATAVDMANFMIAHLQNGGYENQAILQEETARRMHERSFTNDPRVSGIAHGFMEANINNKHVLWHSGDIFQFHTVFALIPEQGTGLYIAYNGANAAFSGLEALKAFMNHYYPISPVEPDSDNINEDMRQYKGTYMPARHEYTTSGKMVGLFSSITIEPVSSNQAKVSFGFPAQFVSQYKLTDSAMLRSIDKEPPIYGDVVFKKDSNNSIQYLFMSNNPTTGYIKLPWYASPTLSLLILGICLVIFLIVIVWAPIDMWIRIRAKKEMPVNARLVKWLIAFVSILGLLFTIGFLTIFSSQKVVFGLPSWASILALVPGLISLSLVGTIALLLVMWKKNYWSKKTKFFYVIVASSAIVFLWWLSYWNLWYLKI